MVAFGKDDVKLGVIGCGKMASAILKGASKHKFLNPDDIYVYDVNFNGNLSNYLLSSISFDSPLLLCSFIN